MENYWKSRSAVEQTAVVVVMDGDVLETWACVRCAFGRGATASTAAVAH